MVIYKILTTKLLRDNGIIPMQYKNKVQIPPPYFFEMGRGVAYEVLS